MQVFRPHLPFRQDHKIRGNPLPSTPHKWPEIQRKGKNMSRIIPIGLLGHGVSRAGGSRKIYVPFPRRRQTPDHRSNRQEFTYTHGLNPHPLPGSSQLFRTLHQAKTLTHHRYVSAPPEHPPQIVGYQQKKHRKIQYAVEPNHSSNVSPTRSIRQHFTIPSPTS
ncbi:MAG: hypothetical protein BWY82_01949 [Verrucomicrobia bacterium ADurb.Bin474]|nr:MAG: hypothetical protein BWY82_01949 [Verrucomicrobia bacterium ADurb.Bin474]